VAVALPGEDGLNDELNLQVSSCGKQHLGARRTHGPRRWWSAARRGVEEGSRSPNDEFLDSAAASAKQQINDHYCQNDTDAAAAIVANARPHIVAPAAEREKQNHENEYERHVRESITPSGATACVSMPEIANGSLGTVAGRAMARMQCYCNHEVPNAVRIRTCHDDYGSPRSSRCGMSVSIVLFTSRAAF
jgi:hypothetical protein